ncbi:MAG: HIT family protein [Nanoarchaeota archaeon]
MEKEKQNQECVFCKISKGEIPAEKILENDNFFIINDANPVVEGHCLVISKKHYKNIFNLPADLGSELISLIKEQSLKLIKEGKAEGIKIVQNNGKSAGQSVQHVHFHIIPEKSGFKREKQV